MINPNLNPNDEHAEWDQRQAYQMRLDNYIRNANFAFKQKQYKLAFQELRLMHIEIKGWIIKNNKKNADEDIKVMDEQAKKVNNNIHIYKGRLQDYFIENMFYDYAETLHTNAHKYGLVMGIRSGDRGL